MVADPGCSRSFFKNSLRLEVPVDLNLGDELLCMAEQSATPHMGKSDEVGDQNEQRQ